MVGKTQKKFINAYNQYLIKNISNIIKQCLHTDGNKMSEASSISIIHKEKMEENIKGGTKKH